MTENKVEKTFYRLIVSIILLMLIGCLFTSYIIIRGKLSESLNREGNLQLAVQKENIENYISNTKSIIEFLAKQETVINASLLDVTNKSDVVYFLKEQNLFPKQASFYILDFEGEEIIRSNEDDEDISNKIVEIIVNSEQSSLINAGKNKDFSYLKFSSPIIFRGSLEGYLVVKVPINYSPQLFQYAETQHYAMEVFYKNTPLLTYGNIESNLNNAVNRTSSLVNGLEIKFWVSKRLMNEAINELIRNIFVFAILVSFLILYFSRRFGKKHILAPHKQLKQSLHDKKELFERLDSLLAVSHTGLWSLDLTSYEIVWDERIVDVFQVEKSQTPKNLSEFKKLIHPDDLESVEKNLQESLEKKKPGSFQFRTIDKSGQVQYIKGISKTVYDSNGVAVSVDGFNWNISQEIEAANEIERQSKIIQQNKKMASIGQLAAGVGHEINNPLAIIRGYIRSLLRKADNLNDSQTGTMEKIDRAAKRIESIVMSLRTFGRQDNNKAISDFSVKKSVASLHDMLEEFYSERNVGLLIDLDGLDENFKIRGLKGTFEQIVINLITNAKDATEERSERLVKVKAYASKESGMFLSVHDNGSGIPKEIRESIFDPFFTTKEVGRGTGIGLSLVHKFINEDFCGKITIIPSDFGQGAAFEVWIPEAEASGIVKPEPSEDTSKGKNSNKESA